MTKSVPSLISQTSVSLSAQEGGLAGFHQVRKGGEGSQPIRLEASHGHMLALPLRQGNDTLNTGLSEATSSPKKRSKQIMTSFPLLHFFGVRRGLREAWLETEALVHGVQEGEGS